MLKGVIAVGLGLCSSLALVPGARADVLMLDPVKDTTIYSPDTVLMPPPPTDRSNGAGLTLYSGRVGGFGGADGVRRALLAFDVDGSVPAGSTINSVTLDVRCTRSPVGMATPRTFTLHRLTSDWGEGPDDAGNPGGNGAMSSLGAASWASNFFGSSAWTTAGGDFVAGASATMVIGGVGNYQFGSTATFVADVQGMLDTPASDFGWILIGEEGSTATAREFVSRDDVGATIPVLTIDFTRPAGVVGTCAGDGSYPSNGAMGCPCGNNSAAASGEGCLNSSFTNGGTLAAFGAGDTSLTNDALRLDAGHPPQNSGLLLVHTSIFNPGNATTGFDGIACVGGGPRVLPGADNGLTQPFGDVDLVAADGIRNLGSTTPGSGLYGLVNATFPGYFAAGVTYHAQFWYRDVLCGPPPAPCVTPCSPTAAANFSNAVTWTVTP